MERMRDYFLDANFSRSSRFQLSTTTACDCSPALFIIRNCFPSGVTSQPACVGSDECHR